MAKAKTTHTESKVAVTVEPAMFFENNEEKRKYYERYWICASDFGEGLKIGGQAIKASTFKHPTEMCCAQKIIWHYIHEEQEAIGIYEVEFITLRGNLDDPENVTETKNRKFFTYVNFDEDEMRAEYHAYKYFESIDLIKIASKMKKSKGGA